MHVDVMRQLVADRVEDLAASARHARHLRDRRNRRTDRDDQGVGRRHWRVRLQALLAR